MPLRRNIAANLIGRIWTMGLAFVFIPVYLKFLGIEAYGLVGIFATIQALSGLLDLGLGTTVGRELATRSATPEALRSQRDLVRTLEVVYLGIATLIALLTILGAGLIVDHWLQIGHLQRGTVAFAIRLMGVAAAVQFAGSFYTGGLMGLERQGVANGIAIATGTVRGVGAVLVLSLLHGGVTAFFVWQLVASVLQSGVSAVVLWRSLPAGQQPIFQTMLLRTVWRFSAWVSANAMVGAALSQADKVVLTKLVSLSEYGYYVLASSAAGMLWALIIPVHQALYPRMAREHAIGDETALATLYHRSCQTVSVLVFPAATVVALFSYELVYIWTGSLLTADHTHLVVTLVVIGIAINGVVSIPGLLQSAAGWPSLLAMTNAVAAVVLIPTLYLLTRRFGVTGAAVTGILVNAGYLLTNVPMMHRRLLRGEMRSWLSRDLMIPLVCTVPLGWFLRQFFPVVDSRFALAALIGIVYLFLLVVCALSTPFFREQARLLLAKGRLIAASRA